MKKSIESHNYSHIYRGVLYLLIALLLILSIFQGKATITNDFQKIINAELSFSDILSLNFPVVENIIGPFGAFFGFYLYLVIGLYFSYVLLAMLLIVGFIIIFFPFKKDLLTKVLFIVGFAFFFNIFLLTLSAQHTGNSGFLINSVYYVLKRVFNTVGTSIISISMSVAFLLAIIETDSIKYAARRFIEIIKIFIIEVIKLFHKSPTAKKKLKIKKEIKSPSYKNSSQSNVRESSENSAPSITNHSDKIDDIQKDNTDKVDSLRSEVKSNNHYPQGMVKKNVPELMGGDNFGDNVYRKPAVEMFLNLPPAIPMKNREKMEKQINHISRLLIDKLSRLGIQAEVVNVNIGPVITQFELLPAADVKVSRFSNVSNDLALAVKAKSIRVEAPIPGKGLVGVEIPNKDREIIYLRDVLVSEEMSNNNSGLAIALGKDIVGNPMIADLAKMPHLLIAGSTGSGKSVCVNSIICNLLFRNEPDDLRMVLIDPKKIELSGYEGIPHLIQNIVSDHEEALSVLQWSVIEMERRYELLRQFNVRDIKGYNIKAKQLQKTEENIETLPYIILVIDEFADLILKSGRDVEMPITRLAQMARAIGIHLIIATQRPSMKIITGLIKANFPAKIAFRVAQKVDSRVILDMNGAESLLGSGDMLFITPTKGLPERIHGAYVSDEEIENLVEYLRNQPKPKQEIEIETKETGDINLVDYDDDLFPDAAKLVVTTGSASVSMLQRHFKIGYARAGRLIDMLEQAKIIGKYAGSKSREVIASNEILEAYNIKT